MNARALAGLGLAAVALSLGAGNCGTYDDTLGAGPTSGSNTASGGASAGDGGAGASTSTATGHGGMSTATGQSGTSTSTGHGGTSTTTGRGGAGGHGGAPSGGGQGGEGGSATGGGHGGMRATGGGGAMATGTGGHGGDGGMGVTSSTSGMGGAGNGCHDGVKDGSESDVDCGGGVCVSCAQGKACKTGGDCLSGNCTGAGTCGCSGVHVLISEVRSRGLGGGSDEFVELYNPTGQDVLLDATWVLDARSHNGAAFNARWTGTGKTLPAHHRYLLGGSAYVQMPAADGVILGVTDASSVRLTHGGATVDVVCYSYSAATSAALLADPTFGCPGTPADNAPHDNQSSAVSNVDSGLERLPGDAAGGNCQDTANSAVDFAKISPATPRDLASAQ